MTKSRWYASLYDGMSRVEALEFSIALEEAVMAEVPGHIRGGDFGSALGWGRFVDRIARRVGWLEALEDRESRHHLVELVSYELVDGARYSRVVVGMSPVTSWRLLRQQWSGENEQSDQAHQEDTQ
jgi:hypothetical protein